MSDGWASQYLRSRSWKRREVCFTSEEDSCRARPRHERQAPMGVRMCLQLQLSCCVELADDAHGGVQWYGAEQWLLHHARNPQEVECRNETSEKFRGVSSGDGVASRWSSSSFPALAPSLPAGSVNISLSINHFVAVVEDFMPDS